MKDLVPSVVVARQINILHFSVALELGQEVVRSGAQHKASALAYKVLLETAV
jgi:hypothetical protein